MRRAIPDEGLTPPSGTAAREKIDEFLEAVLVDFILKLEDGLDPDIDTYLARFPNHAEDLAFLLSQHGAPPQVQTDAGSTTRQRTRGFAMRKLGPYEILFHVATAGGGSVYKATPREGGDAVALKVFRKDTVVDEREIARFEREAVILRQLDVPRVIPIIDLGEAGELLWMAMAWIEGPTLAQVIGFLSGSDEVTPVPPRLSLPDERLTIIRKAALALDAVHAQGVHHRDLKPSNIMVRHDLEPVIIDFGIARDEDRTRITRTADAPLGTPRFMPPELLMGDAKAATVQSDVYSLGMTLYELLTLASAFDGTDRRTLFAQILDGRARPAHKVKPEIPKALSRAIGKSIAREPADRFESMAAFAVALEGHEFGEAGGPRRRRWWPFSS